MTVACWRASVCSSAVIVVASEAHELSAVFATAPMPVLVPNVFAATSRKRYSVFGFSPVSSRR